MKLVMHGLQAKWVATGYVGGPVGWGCYKAKQAANGIGAAGDGSSLIIVHTLIT